MKVKSLMSYVFLVSVFYSTQAHCSSGSTGEQRVKGTIAYSNEQGRIAISSHSNNFRNLVNTYYNIEQIKTELAQKMEAMYRTAIYGTASFRSFNSDFRGDFEIIIEGSNNGITRVKIGGISVHALGQLNYHGYAKGTISFSTSKVWLVGDYNIYTGEFSNLRPSETFSVSSDVSISSPLRIIDALDRKATQLEKSFESDIISNITAGLDGIKGQSISFQGLNDNIPDNVYMYDGVDLGRETKQIFAGLINGQKVSIKINSQKSTYMGNNLKLANVEIRLPNNIFLRFIEDPEFSEFKTIQATATGGNSSSLVVQAKNLLISQNPTVDRNTITTQCHPVGRGRIVCVATAKVLMSSQGIVVRSIVYGHNPNESAARKNAVDKLLALAPDIINSSIKVSCEHGKVHPGSPTVSGACSATGEQNRTCDFTGANSHIYNNLLCNR